MLQGGMQWGELQGLQGLPMPEGVPLQRSGVSGIMEGMRLAEGAGDAAEHVAQSRGEYIDHSALEHLCVSMDYSHGGGPQGGHAAAGRSSLPPAVALSVTHRYRGKVIETVLVKPLPVQAGLDAARPAPWRPCGPVVTRAGRRHLDSGIWVPNPEPIVPILFRHRTRCASEASVYSCLCVECDLEAFSVYLTSQLQ